jgi:hypothetical protein
MVCVVPKATTLGWIDQKYRKVNLKLQLRYAGPYLIVKKISPVVYALKVDGVERIFHAVNMKPYSGRQDSLTPYVEPGYERLEAGELRKPQQPLLLSPDPVLNEQASNQYMKKKMTAKQLTAKAEMQPDRSQTEQRKLDGDNQTLNH